MSTCRAFVVDGLSDSCVSAREDVIDKVGGHSVSEECKPGVWQLQIILKWMRLSEMILSMWTFATTAIDLVVDKIRDQGVCAHRYTCTLKPVNGDAVGNVRQAQKADVGR